MRGRQERHNLLPLTVPVGARVVAVHPIALLLLGPLACCLCGWMAGLWNPAEPPPWIARWSIQWFDALQSGSLAALFGLVILCLALTLLSVVLLVQLIRVLQTPTFQPIYSFLEAWATFFETLLSRRAEGTLRLDRVGLRLQTRDAEKVMRWEAPIQLRRWGMRLAGDESKARYREVWELTQGQVQIRLSRRVSPAKLERLPAPPASELEPTKGLLVPQKYERVFDTILWLGNIELADVKREPC